MEKSAKENLPVCKFRKQIKIKGKPKKFFFKK